MNYLSLMKYQGAKGIYNLGEYRGIDAFDFSGNGLNQNLVGAPGLASPYLCTDWPGYSMLFGAAGAYVGGGAASALPFRSKTSISVSAIIKPTDVTNGVYGGICTIGVGIYGQLYLTKNGTNLEAWWYDGTYNHVVSSVNCNLAANTRYHVGVTRNIDGKTYKFYVNGALISTVVGTAAPINDADLFYIGTLDGTQQYFPGYIERVSVFPLIELDAAQMLAQNLAAFRVWPTNHIFEPDNYNEQAISVSFKQKTITGPGMTVPTASAPLIAVKGSFECTIAEKDAIKSFFIDRIENGSVSFEGTLRGEATPVRYMLKPPMFPHDYEPDVECSLDLMVLP